MNKVITDGLVLMPPAFAHGLDIWSSGNGTQGSPTYAASDNGGFVPADHDFSGCLEIVKTDDITKLRYMGETTIMPGCYIRVTARVKCLSGALPDVRIAGYPVRAGGAALDGVATTAPTVSLHRYGEVVEVSAIIGTRARTGVDLVWPQVNFGHIGVDLTGPNGGIVRIDDLVIEDVSSAFLRDTVGLVDVRDYGAIGDGVTDDSGAFLAADREANGREVLIPQGVFVLDQSVTFNHRVQFHGRVVQSQACYLLLRKNFNYPAYVDAFGDAQVAFKKAVQALWMFSDHDSLDLCGRRIALSGPVDMHAALGHLADFERRRVIRNGQVQPAAGAAWENDVVVAQATYSSAHPTKLTNVAGISTIAPGSLVTAGHGVGREVYVTSVNIAKSTITLNTQLFDANGTQNFTFTRFKYMLDFSGCSAVSNMILADLNFTCDGVANGVLLPPEGQHFQVRDCTFQRPKHRAITSHGTGCDRLILDRNQFSSDERGVAAGERQSIAVNINADDAKLRSNRSDGFRHFAVLQGTGNIIANNHCARGNDGPAGDSSACIVLSAANCATTIFGNHMDTCFIEWANEHTAGPDALDEAFCGLTINGNLFFASDVAHTFSWIVIKPHGADCAIDGLSVQGNVFRSRAARIDSAEKIDTECGDLRCDLARNITFGGNTFNGVNRPAQNPQTGFHEQIVVDDTWAIKTANRLPFGGFARRVEALVPVNMIKGAQDAAVFVQPYSVPATATNSETFDVVWPAPVRGAVRYTVRMDDSD